MKHHRRIILAGILALATAFPLMAQQQKANIMRTDGKQLAVDAITADANGNLSYRDGQVTMRMRPNEYRWAWVPKPKEITAVEQLVRANSFADAATQARELYEKFKFLGWDVYLIWLETNCLARLERDDETIARLEILDGVNPTEIDPRKLSSFYECRKRLADLYIKGKKTDQAATVLNQLLSAQDDNIVAFALNAQGDILAQQNKKRDAALMYLRTVLLFPKENAERPRALVQVANLLKGMNDNRASTFADMLRTDYPDNRLIQDLK